MATLKDIAKRSGVSTATVSYVLNKGPRAVLPATRDRVLSVVADLGYYPNPHARGLRGKASNTLGIVFPHVVAQPFENDYFGPTLSGIMDVTTERRMATMLFTGYSWEEAEQKAPEFCDGRCDCLLLIAPPREGRLIQELRRRKIHTVVVGTHPAGAPVNTVDSDNVGGGRMAGVHLVSLGHRRMAIAMGAESSSYSEERRAGFEEALNANGLELAPERVVPSIHDQAEYQYERLRALLLNPKLRPTALFCVQDWTAIRVLSLAKELGLSVPGDLSVVGFDDTGQAARAGLTTLRQPVRQIGLRAAELACAPTKDPAKPPETVLFDLQLIERASTARPKAT